MTVKAYSCWWMTPEGEKHELGEWFSSESEATAYCAKILSIYEDAKDEYPSGYGDNCEKGVMTRETPTIEWALDTATVLLDEEYGYRTWIWHTGMSDTELIAFWKGLPSVNPYFYTPVGLPGTLVPCWIGAHSAKGIYTFDPTTVKVDKSGEYAGEEVFLKWPCGSDPAKNRWMGHIHMDDDSGIGHPDHGRVVHAGYRDSEEEE